MWTLYELVSDGSGIVVSWRDGLRPAKTRDKVWVTFCARWRDMRKLQHAQWPSRWTEQLTGYPGVLEMKLKVSQHQYRPLFFFGPHRRAITFLFMADEVGDKFVPLDAPDRAERARENITNGRSKVRELDID